MIKQKLLCLYHPTTVVLVDDDERFLKQIIFNISSDLLYKTYQDPKLAIKNLEEIKNQNKFLSHTISAKEQEGGKFSVDFDTSIIYQEAYNEEAFEEVSVIVVDYAMPQMSGAELLEHLIDFPAKKIMLTGQADEATAVRLFNDGVIDKFIFKGSDAHSLIKNLNQSIHELQMEYFQDSSNIILKALSGKIEESFIDPIFIEFFNNTMKDISASSYYMIEPSGSFLFLDANALPTWLLVKTKHETLEFAHQAEVEGAPQAIVESIRNGEKIPYFSNFDEYVNATEGHWDKYLYPAKVLNGKKQYRYAIINELSGFSLNRDKILSFNEYLKRKLS